ncbi:MAG: DUF2314 domain-containing protein [Planctomycetia bacterium]|nr:DUF2314 domain-containing protein [Planctomycetia bacterium]
MDLRPRSTRALYLALIYAALAVAVALPWAVPAWGGSWVHLIAALALVAAATAQWFTRPWAHYLAALELLLLSADSALRYGLQRAPLGYLIAAPALIVAAWAVLRFTVPRPRVETPEPPLISLVMLLSEPKYMDAAILARLAAQAWGAEVVDANLLADDETPIDDVGGGADGPGAPAFVLGESPYFLVRCRSTLYAVHNGDAPYFEEPADYEHVRELRLRKAIEQHRGWFSIDVLSGDEALVCGRDAGLLEDAYRSIGRLVAELADETCLALYCPATGEINLYDPALESHLRGDDPLSVLRRVTQAPVVMLDGNDPRLLAAVSEARQRFAEFLAAFERREEGAQGHFWVKAPVRDGPATEYMWLNVSAVENDVVYGRLDNVPVDLKRVALGDRLRVDVQDLSDWMYVESGRLHGGFTMKRG